jgi:N-methylhydantoinase A/oxoprolinase/acetone carboxylase beta subunit
VTKNKASFLLLRHGKIHGSDFQRARDRRPPLCGSWLLDLRNGWLDFGKRELLQAGEVLAKDKNGRELKRRCGEMGYTIDVDTGGTCTDGLFSDGKNLTWVKVDTTANDLTTAFNKCLDEGTKKLGFSNVSEFLDQVHTIRWSSTIASNVIAEKAGPKLGLFVSKGCGESLYGEATTSPAIGYLVDRSNIAELAQPVNPNELLKGLKEILAKGIRRIVISLKGSFYDNTDELQVKDVIAEQYPEHYLGSVPILSGEDICKHPDDMTRTHAALLNAYVHGPMATSLFKEEDYLREKGYLKPLLIGHIDGGVTRVSKTKPIDTIESGPIFGVYGSGHFARIYGLQKVLTLDVGGTTSKIGWLHAGKPIISTENKIFGIPIKLPLINLTSIALGGGTVAHIDKEGKLALGPKSMGAFPGPAAYDLGGTEATLTDAFTILGYLNPKYFAGGTKKLNVAKAEGIIQQRVAGTMGSDLAQASIKIALEAFNLLSREIKRASRSVGNIADYVLFAFGGNGGVFACNVAEELGIDKVYIFSMGSVLSALGSSIADISHSYEFSPSIFVDRYQDIHKIVGQLREQALRDMEGEGLNLNNVTVDLSFQVSDGRHSPITVESRYLDFDNIGDSKAIKMVFNEKAPSGHSREKPIIELIKLTAKHPSPTPELARFPKGKPDSSVAIKEKRDAVWMTGRAVTNVYDWDLLQTGNIVNGPAIIESYFTNYLIPPSWQLAVDEYKNGVLERRR